MTAGPGAVPMLNAAGGYTVLATEIRTAATNLQHQVLSLMHTWRGPAATRAQTAFLKNLAWMHELAAILDFAATRAGTQATAHTTAVAAMPPLPAILALQSATAKLIATNVMQTNNAFIAINTGIYFTMWMQAAAVMNSYASATVPNVVLPTPTIAPDIVSPVAAVGGGVSMLPEALMSMPTGPVGGGPAPSTAPAPNPGAGPNPPANPPVAPSTPTSPGNPTTPTTPDTSTPGTLNPVDGHAPEYGGYPGTETSEIPSEHGFLGTSPYSPTLAALHSGSMTGVGLAAMTTGGLSSMSGTSTGFRMPANWAARTATAFGIAPTSLPAQFVPATAPRGVSAPAAQTRRAHDRDDENARVFTPRDEYDVPELVPVSAVGVIEYDDTNH
ncbi:PPE family protein [Nocardia sp. 2]|uniref:PPE family protein n=1 Tax=Nocardia acididurans TaxID=2802282 RepID=A0ABS1MHM9_9NOCA|nr:PPE family protein [Nocardia acididurans]